MSKQKDRDQRSKDDHGLGHYHCCYCGRLRYVGNIYRCHVGNKVTWSPTPWGVACKPDENGVKQGR